MQSFLASLPQVNGSSTAQASLRGSWSTFERALHDAHSEVTWDSRTDGCVQHSMAEQSTSQAVSLAPTVEISPGVHMPLVNLGISNHTTWIGTGGRGLDTALVYGDDAQAETGRAVRASGLPRSSLFVTTKVPCCPAPQWAKFNNITDKAMCSSIKSKYGSLNTTAQVEHDLQTLGLDYVDLLLLHWPCDRFEDTLKTYQALEALVAAGKARAIGVSNFDASLIDQLVAAVKVKPAVNQCGYSLMGHYPHGPEDVWGRDDATVAMCKKHNVTYEAYSPLGGWALGGTGSVLKDPTVLSIAAAHNKSSAQVALRWLVQQGIVVVTSSNEAAYDQADLALWDFQLTDAEMATLAALSLSHQRGIGWKDFPNAWRQTETITTADLDKAQTDDE